MGKLTVAWPESGIVTHRSDGSALSRRRRGGTDGAGTSAAHLAPVWPSGLDGLRQGLRLGDGQVAPAFVLGLALIAGRPLRELYPAPAIDRRGARLTGRRGLVAEGFLGQRIGEGLGGWVLRVDHVRRVLGGGGAQETEAVRRAHPEEQDERESGGERQGPPR